MLRTGRVGINDRGGSRQLPPVARSQTHPAKDGGDSPAPLLDVRYILCGRCSSHGDGLMAFYRDCARCGKRPALTARFCPRCGLELYSPPAAYHSYASTPPPASLPQLAHLDRPTPFHPAPADVPYQSAPNRRTAKAAEGSGWGIWPMVILVLVVIRGCAWSFDNDDDRPPRRQRSTPTHEQRTPDLPAYAPPAPVPTPQGITKSKNTVLPPDAPFSIRPENFRPPHMTPPPRPYVPRPTIPPRPTPPQPAYPAPLQDTPPATPR